MVVLTSEEIEEFRADFESGWQVWPNGKRYSDREALLVTLEAMQSSMGIWKAGAEALEAERDTWRAEAEDRRAEVERLERDRDNWKAQAKGQLAAVTKAEREAIRLQTETDVLRAKLCRLNTEPMRIPG